MVVPAQRLCKTQERGLRKDYRDTEGFCCNNGDSNGEEIGTELKREWDCLVVHEG